MDTILCPISKFSQAYYHHPAIEFDDNKIITYGQLNLIIQQIANKLSTGLSTGYTLAWTPQQTWQDLVLIWACFRASKIAFPIHSRLTDSERLKYVNDTQSHYLSDTEKDNLFNEINPDKNSNKILVNQHIKKKQLATYLLTSGSSGTPKIAVHAFENHAISASTCLYNIPMIQHDRILLNLPLYHVSGIATIFRTFLSGSTLVLTKKSPVLSTLIKQHRISHLSVVPTQLNRLLAGAERAVFPSLVSVLIGGAPCPKEIIKKAHQSGLPIYKTYGCTELSSQISCTTFDDNLDTLINTSGAILNAHRVKINSAGHICVKSPALFRGYLKNGKIILKTDSDGFFDTGDIGHTDKANNLSITGRADRMFISGGENIQPEEIEKHILSVEGIKACHVEAVNDTQMGMRPIAYIGTEIPLDEAIVTIQKTLTQNLAHFKHPINYLPISQAAIKSWKEGG